MKNPILQILIVTYNQSDFAEKIIRSVKSYACEEIQVMIIEVNREKERVSLGLKQTTKNPWDEIERKFPVGSKVHGKVVNLVPYGAFIEIEPGVEGLVHITEMSWTKRITKPSELLKVGQELDAVVLGIQKDDQKI